MGLCTKCSACCESFWQAVEKGNFKRWVRLPRTPWAPAPSKARERDVEDEGGRPRDGPSVSYGLSILPIHLS